ncbi:hypothetical protein SLE2022_153040 [Rubroshorea leprosula]
MSDQYENVNGSRLTFKGDSLATRKTIDKKKKKKHKNKNDDESHQSVDADAAESGAGEQTYTIDAAKRMKYEDLFPSSPRSSVTTPRMPTPSPSRMPSMIASRKMLIVIVNEASNRHCAGVCQTNLPRFMILLLVSIENFHIDVQCHGL